MPFRAISWVAERLGFKSRETPVDEAERHFIYVKIPEPLGPIARGERFKDPLQESLDAHRT
jgi:hypothetical protein